MNILSNLFHCLLPGFHIKREIDLGDLLTSLTIFGSLISWLIVTYQRRNETKQRDQRSGALRFLLKILREKEDKIFSFHELRKEFELQNRKDERVSYCGDKFKFENESKFEACIYQLDFEGKIDFISNNQIKFRVDSYVAKSL